MPESAPNRKWLAVIQKSLVDVRDPRVTNCKQPCLPPHLSCTRAHGFTWNSYQDSRNISFFQYIHTRSWCACVYCAIFGMCSMCEYVSLLANRMFVMIRLGHSGLVGLFRYQHNTGSNGVVIWNDFTVNNTPIPPHVGRIKWRRPTFRFFLLLVVRNYQFKLKCYFLIRVATVARWRYTKSWSQEFVNPLSARIPSSAGRECY